MQCFAGWGFDEASALKEFLASEQVILAGHQILEQLKHANAMSNINVGMVDRVLKQIASRLLPKCQEFYSAEYGGGQGLVTDGKDGMQIWAELRKTQEALLGVKPLVTSLSKQDVSASELIDALKNTIGKVVGTV